MPELSDIKSFLHYDLETGIFTWIKHHFKNLVGKRAGRLNSAGYRQISINDKLYYEHQLAFLYVTGSFVLNVDHKDLNKSNNKWENLRKATDTQNNVNIKVRKTNKLGIKGVRLLKGKFNASIRINGKVKSLGSFNTIEEASLAYNEKAKEIHGEFYNNGDHECQT